MDIETYLYRERIGAILMNNTYVEYVQLFKALADETRLKIIELLSNGEMCACKLLENFNITQPTLSYHMKLLCDSGLVKGRREGAWMYYRNNSTEIENISEFLLGIKLNQRQSDN